MTLIDTTIHNGLSKVPGIQGQPGGQRQREYQPPLDCLKDCLHSLQPLAARCINTDSKPRLATNLWEDVVRNLVLSRHGSKWHHHASSLKEDDDDDDDDDDDHGPCR